jgi:hypothetical protein
MYSNVVHDGTSLKDLIASLAVPSPPPAAQCLAWSPRAPAVEAQNVARAAGLALALVFAPLVSLVVAAAAAAAAVYEV